MEPGTEQEIFSLEELVQAFSLQRVNKSGARFDPDKNKWYNQHYLHEASNTSLANAFQDQLLSKQDLKTSFPIEYVEKVVALIKERATFVSDFWELSDYFFASPSTYSEKAVKKQWKEDTPEILSEVRSLLKIQDNFSSSNIETVVKDWIQEKELSFGKVMPPLRLVIVGDMKGPHLFDIMAMIGKTESLTRIENAIKTLP